MKIAITTLLFLLISINVAKSARILLVFVLPGRSHYILGSSLARALAERGHDVTILSPFSEKNPPKNGTYRDITLTGFFEELQEMMKKEMNMFDQEDMNPFSSAMSMTFMMPSLIAKTYEHENFKNFIKSSIKSNEKFDVVIIEQFMNDALKALSTHFEAPLIVFSSLGPNLWVNRLVGNPAPLSYIPDFLLQYSSNMTFCERVVNTLIYLWNEFLTHVIHFPNQNKTIREHIIPNGPELKDVLYNASLVLLNSHPSINQPVPHVPNMIDIGGFHVKPPKKLPQDLQEFLDDAKDGVIYFSMGSNLKSAQLPVEKREALLKTFAKLKEKVLWKWEEDVLPGQPSNVKLGKWLPQQDILAHPNVKLFITHGGLLSTTETVYHGVPILAIPVFGDQKMNAQTAINNGFGLSVPYSKLSEQLLTENINELLKNPKYRNNAKARSKVFHDRPVPPLETAIYWVEYVIRHKGAPHLRVAALDLPWYKYLLLDVIGFLALICLFSTIVVCYILKKICSRKSTQKNTKLKQK